MKENGLQEKKAWEWKKRVLGVLLVFMSFSVQAMAQMSPTTMPWDAGLGSLGSIFSNNLVKTIGIIAIAILGTFVILNRDGDAKDFLQRIIQIVLIIAGVAGGKLMIDMFAS